MEVYERLGVKRRINGCGTLTRLGGSLMPEEVLVAMREAAASHVDIAELQAAASKIIAKHTGAEAGIVSSGAAACLTLGMAACLTGFDVAKMERLPHTEGMKHEVIICRHHRTAYDHAFRAAGARLVEIGFNDRVSGAGVRGVEAWEFEAAITEHTVAVAYLANAQNQPPLEMVCEVAHKHGLPVIVDAAAQLPPPANLRKFIAAGADLVAYSGGKALRGPQGTGILCGKQDLISAAIIQQLDMDVAPETWAPPADLIPKEKLNGIPHHGLGRGFKVSKEDIAGLVTALERFSGLDAATEEARYLKTLDTLQAGVQGVPNLGLRVLSAKETGRNPLLELALQPGAKLESAYDFSARLQQNDPPIHLSERRAAEGILTIDPAGLREGDAMAVASAVKALLG